MGPKDRGVPIETFGPNAGRFLNVVGSFCAMFIIIGAAFSVFEMSRSGKFDWDVNDLGALYLGFFAAAIFLLAGWRELKRTKCEVYQGWLRIVGGPKSVWVNLKKIKKVK